jgi:aryl-alcohol dehydrogenase-like predicted oxidoreductase
MNSVKSLLQAFDAGIRCFDCGDIYTGVEDLFGRFIRAHLSRGGKESDIAIHTKLVPDLDSIKGHTVDEGYIQSVVRRSLNRLGVRCVSLVQFYWWDTMVPGYMEALHILTQLKRDGLIRSIGISNFDAGVTELLIDEGIEIASTQVG